VYDLAVTRVKLAGLIAFAAAVVSAVALSLTVRSPEPASSPPRPDATPILDGSYKIGLDIAPGK